MLLKKLFVRFYKSFNYDYLKKSSLEPSQEKPWEWVDLEKTLWYPYIEIPIDEKITTVVGANESGKSHLLDAISKGITGQGIKHQDQKDERIEREDFCRYSQFFTVTTGELKFPDFGFEWTNLSIQEQDKLRELASISPEINCESFFMFRTQKDTITIYDTENLNSFVIEDNPSIQSFLPKILPIQSKVALPDSVPIQKLIDIDRNNSSSQNSAFVFDLEQWKEIHELLIEISTEDEIPCNQTHTTGQGYTDDSGDFRPTPNYTKDFFNISPKYKTPIETRNNLRKLLRNKTTTQQKQNEYNLAYKLICKVAEIDSESLDEILKNPYNVQKQGYVAAIIDRINKNLSERLNFPSWWVQDKEFNLVVSANNYHLKFAIKDKTGTTYSFSERSQGLKYFLSYYIQYKSHEPSANPPANQQEILLMDEPDAFLSSQAQQDLMKIFKAFSDNQNGKLPIQVIFVTHSPFLIDKNHPERIRVLQKGVEEEGTRLVNDMGRNHYEPLRSSIGSLVGETAFIGNCNLIVSRFSDKVLLAGLANYLNQFQVSDSETLDLNHITIVPAGDVSQIPYLIDRFQIDTEKPAMVVLLNNDELSQKVSTVIRQSSTETKTALRKGKCIKDNFICHLEKGIANKATESQITELEDLIPPSIAIKAIQKYVRIFSDHDLFQESTQESTIENSLDPKLPLFENLYNFLEKQEIILDRLGFVKSLIDVLQENSLSESDDAVKEITDNFKKVFIKINNAKRDAELHFNQEKIGEKVGRFIKAFKLDHKQSARKVDAEELFKKIEAVLDDSEESSETRKTIDSLRRDYEITTDPLSQISVSDSDYHKFYDQDLEKIKYTPLLATQDNQDHPKNDSNPKNNGKEKQPNSTTPKTRAKRARGKSQNTDKGFGTN
ncbi:MULTISPECIES: AAA family ATPase [Spirulina sp. CCY15215]|uniref:AAA family ATPase n=1 Tax=Spirulina sp. CCY15215 TaxID=2767591 RepID=UPI00194F09D4|nr:AAA family ATPase [Spirulina major]